MSENGIEKVNAEIVPAAEALVLMPVMNIGMAKKRLAEFQEFIKEYLVPEEDFGTIPGTAKPTLLKPGADKLCEIYGLSDDYVIEKSVERFDTKPELFDYTVKCILKTRRDERFVGAGYGSCNSFEGKYLYRETRRKCPLCGKEAIIKGNEQYGGGWVCWKKKEGCGAKFLDGDESIVGQKAGKEINEDIPTLKNTVLKMAKKRSKIDAVIAATRSSGIFTQDMEDITDRDASNGSGSVAAAQRVGENKVTELKAKAEAKNDPPKAKAKKATESLEIVEGILKDAKEVKTNGGNRFLAVVVRGKNDKFIEMSSWANHEFPDKSMFWTLVQMCMGKPVSFNVKRTTGNGVPYLNIVGVNKLNTISFHENVPVIQREPVPEYQPVDADIPF